MREIMRKMAVKIRWDVVACAMLAFVGIVLVFVSLVTALTYENAWLLLILLPAGACLSLSMGIYSIDC